MKHHYPLWWPIYLFNSVVNTKLPTYPSVIQTVSQSVWLLICQYNLRQSTIWSHQSSTYLSSFQDQFTYTGHEEVFSLWSVHSSTIDININQLWWKICKMWTIKFTFPLQICKWNLGVNTVTQGLARFVVVFFTCLRAEKIIAAYKRRLFKIEKNTTFINKICWFRKWISLEWKNFMQKRKHYFKLENPSG